MDFIAYLEYNTKIKDSVRRVLNTIIKLMFLDFILGKMCSILIYVNFNILFKVLCFVVVLENPLFYISFLYIILQLFVYINEEISKQRLLFVAKIFELKLVSLLLRSFR